MVNSRIQSSDAVPLIVRSSTSAPTIRITDALLRQKTIIVLSTALTSCLGVLYLQYANEKYVTTARVMVNERDSGHVKSGGTTELGDDLINEDVLANHMELLQSRRNVTNALEHAGLLELPSVLSELDDDQDAVDYVVEQLKLSRGGKGDSRAARTMLLEFQHTEPGDAQQILDCVVEQYMKLVEQRFKESLATANTLVIDAQQKIQIELQAAQQRYVESRKNAPVLFTGSGSSNVYVEQYKSLSSQLVDLEIRESTTSGRLNKANDVAQQYADVSVTMPIEALGVIDTDSLERLGVFAHMRADSTRSADFQMNQPERLEEARAQYSQLLRLMLEKQRVEADFGAGHPDVQKLNGEIDLVKKFLDDNKVASDNEADEPQLTSRQLLGAYTGFLKNELASLAEQKRELTSRISHAETRARSLVDFELQDELLRSRIDRNQQLFDGFVEQLRSLNMANNVDRNIHEILESPRRGIKVWPKRSIVLLAAVILGLMGGVFLALINDQLKNQFHTAREIDSAVELPVLGYINRLPLRNGKETIADNANDGEAFRMLRAMLLTEVKSGRLSSIATASASAGDGKSTVAVHLAAAFARLEMPVILVEADMRRPVLQRRLQLNSDVGLADVLAGHCTLEKAICATNVPNLHVIHAGRGTNTPAELLESETFESMLKELRSRFVLTIVDTGPVLAVSDSLVVSRQVDGTVLVVRPSLDTRQQIIGSAEMLRAGRAKLLGLIVNTFGSSRRFQDSSLSYGYGSSHGRPDMHQGTPVWS